MADTNNLFVWEQANLFCGDQTNDGTTADSQHLRLRELKLPTIEEQYVSHMPGGAMVGYEVDTHIKEMEATFTLAGWQPEVMTMIGQSNVLLQRFTAYGVIRDRRQGIALAAKAIMWGRLGRVAPSQWRKGDLYNHEYSIRSINHYELWMDGTQLYLWDFFLNQFQVGGIDVMADINQILAIPVAAPA